MDQSGAMTPMPQYQSHKKVWAIKIASVENLGPDTTTDESAIVLVRFEGNQFAPRKFNLRGKPTPEAGWYFVQYEDGYESFSPGKAFEEGNTLMTANTARWQGIGWAVKQMHDGAKVARAGWNGKGMFLYYVPEGQYPARTEVAKAEWGEDALVPYQAYVAMKTAQGTVVPWLCSQTDLLAIDWEIAS